MPFAVGEVEMSQRLMQESKGALKTAVQANKEDMGMLTGRLNGSNTERLQLGRRHCALQGEWQRMKEEVGSL